MSSERCQSAQRLLARLAADPGATAMYQKDALWHTQIEWTLQLLDAVDEAAGPATGALVADLIYERASRDGKARAEARMRELERLRWAPIGVPHP